MAGFYKIYSLICIHLHVVSCSGHDYVTRSPWSCPAGRGVRTWPAVRRVSPVSHCSALTEPMLICRPSVLCSLIIHRIMDENCTTAGRAPPSVRTAALPAQVSETRTI